ncbi:spore coat protein CotH, partial [Pseudomonas aeruginosa]
QRTANDRRFAKGASKEVMVKITGSAKTKQGIKNSIDYIGREGDVSLMDEKGNQYHANDIDKVKERIIDSDDKTRVTNGKGKNNP